MTPKDLIASIESADKLAADMGLPPPPGLNLVIVRDKPPQGMKIKTPFGNCAIMNCQEIGGRCQTVFHVTRKQILSYVKRATK